MDAVLSALGAHDEDAQHYRQSFRSSGAFEAQTHYMTPEETMPDSEIYTTSFEGAMDAAAQGSGAESHYMQADGQHSYDFVDTLERSGGGLQLPPPPAPYEQNQYDQIDTLERH